MSYKTILVHLNDPRRAEALLEPAVTLASKDNAHLIGLHVHAAVPAPPIAVPYSGQVLGSIVAADREQAEQLTEIFQRVTANQPFVAEWRSVKVPHVDLAPVVMDHGRAADLIIAGQTDPDWDLSPLMDFPERLALESGRPVVVVPYIGRYPNIGRNIVIAWKAARESARAVFDALPLLSAAEAVQILEVKERDDTRPALTADTSIAVALSRHGIRSTVRSTVAGDIGIGDEILSRLSDLGADLLVMGAYGHSRMREMIFGGATRHIFRHMTVPVLFAH
ncbi:MAG TPA: universal stress protein [Hyphomicrobiaceae bacterium]|nr:universal stress protein [Hyphomicrobiaceae bacterium]